jgi:hypothetical protein
MTKQIKFIPGKLPFKADKYGRDLKYDNYRIDKLVGDIPTAGGYKGRVSDFGMLANDTLGDCGPAGIDHGFMQTNTLAGKPIQFDPANTISDYSAITGYNPDDPNSDQGTDMQTAYSYVTKTGMIDKAGKRHKIGAYLGLNNTQAQLQEVIYIYDRAGIGFNFPSYAMTAFNNGQAWDYKPGQKYTIDGGHYVEGIYYDATGVTVVTWGKEQLMTWAFFLKFCDESYLLVDDELLNAQGLTPNGLNVDLLNQDLTIIKAGGIPITNVTPTPNPPTPTPTPIGANVQQAIADTKLAQKQTSIKLVKPILATILKDLGAT